MKIYHSDDILPEKIDGKSIFLAGPTPRNNSVLSWRPAALEILKKSKYDGTVFIPEHRNWAVIDYLTQTEWEYFGLSNSSFIIFWIPRDLQTMPAFTTNVEFGYWLAKSPEKIIYGRPDNTPKTAYLDWLYSKHIDSKPFNNLEETLLASINEVV